MKEIAARMWPLSCVGCPRHPGSTQNADQQSLPCTNEVLTVGGCGLDIALSLDYPRVDLHPTTTPPTPMGRGLSSREATTPHPRCVVRFACRRSPFDVISCESDPECMLPRGLTASAGSAEYGPRTGLGRGIRCGWGPRLFSTHMSPPRKECRTVGSCVVLVRNCHQAGRGVRLRQRL